MIKHQQRLNQTDSRLEPTAQKRLSRAQNELRTSHGYENEGEPWLKFNAVDGHLPFLRTVEHQNLILARASSGTDTPSQIFSNQIFCFEAPFAQSSDVRAVTTMNDPYAYVNQFVNQYLRIEVHDDRFFIGQLKCVDGVSYTAISTLSTTMLTQNEGLQYNTPRYPRISATKGHSRSATTASTWHTPDQWCRQI